MIRQGTLRSPRNIIFFSITENHCSVCKYDNNNRRLNIFHSGMDMPLFIHTLIRLISVDHKQSCEGIDRETKFK